MKTVTHLTLALFLSTITSGYGQTNRPLIGNTAPSCGTSTVTEDTFKRPTSITDLIKSSDLVVDGTVSAVLPSFNPRVDKPRIMETDSLVSVQAVLSGKVSAGASSILVSQTGGKMGCTEEENPDNPLLKARERYIFFLVDDNRRPTPNKGGPRYAVTGIWSGKAQVVNGKIHFPSRASSQLHQHDDEEATAFLDAVRSASLAAKK
jgi:hypothetical protein